LALEEFLPIVKYHGNFPCGALECFFTSVLASSYQLLDPVLNALTKLRRYNQFTQPFDHEVASDAQNDIIAMSQDALRHIEWLTQPTESLGSRTPSTPHHFILVTIDRIERGAEMPSSSGVRGTHTPYHPRAASSAVALHSKALPIATTR
jgi:hypothetical protein